MRTGETTLESKGATLYAQWWLPESPARAVVAIVHGYAEHSGRYAQTAADLVAKGYAVEALDLRGHGRSSGERVYVESYEDYLTDVDAFLDRVRKQHPGKKLFLLGHSMGGGVVSSYIIDRKPKLDGVILSGAAMLARREDPPAGTPPSPPRSGPLPADTISRDPAVVAAYESDPLVYRGVPPDRTGAAWANAYRAVQEGMAGIAYPLLILHGTDDKLVPYRGSVQLNEVARSTDKTLKLYEGLYHEVLNEPEREQVIADMVAWLDARS
ncbi:MAG: alpha/beta hydrolase [Dehalococcoidia bacterium]|nr:alpha/beta hydrolase [Dehalococcoidia bacterium]